MTPETTPDTPATPDDTGGIPQDWTARRFFQALTTLGPLRVIAINGPSVFETFCEVTAFKIMDGYLNVFDDRYHWHLRLDGFGHLTSREEVHERSGRKVLYFELRESAAADPFLRIYLFRGLGADFGAAREARFAELHEQLRDGREIRLEGGRS
jgi:hypothetical protein